MSGETVAERQIRSFFERWQRLEEEKQTVSDHLKDLFAEAKGVGFDTKALRAVFRDMMADSAERQEFEAIYDLYWSALNAPRAHPAHDARENITQFPPKGEPKSPAVGDSPSAISVNPTATSGDEGGDSANEGGGHEVGQGIANPTENETTSGAPKLAAPAFLTIPQSSPPSSPSVETIGRDCSPTAVSATPYLNPKCQHPGSCRWSNSMASCASCEDIAMRARAAA